MLPLWSTTSDHKHQNASPHVSGNHSWLDPTSQLYMQINIISVSKTNVCCLNRRDGAMLFLPSLLEINLGDHLLSAFICRYTWSEIKRRRRRNQNNTDLFQANVITQDVWHTRNIKYYCVTIIIGCSRRMHVYEPENTSQEPDLGHSCSHTATRMCSHLHLEPPS